jgi:hypothetical protein
MPGCLAGKNGQGHAHAQGFLNSADKRSGRPTHAHTRTHTNMYAYMHVCICSGICTNHMHVPRKVIEGHHGKIQHRRAIHAQVSIVSPCDGGCKEHPDTVASHKMRSEDASTALGAALGRVLELAIERAALGLLLPLVLLPRRHA